MNPGAVTYILLTHCQPVSTSNGLTYYEKKYLDKSWSSSLLDFPYYLGTIGNFQCPDVYTKLLSTYYEMDCGMWFQNAQLVLVLLCSNIGTYSCSSWLDWKEVAKKILCNKNNIMYNVHVPTYFTYQYNYVNVWFSL